MIVREIDWLVFVAHQLFTLIQSFVFTVNFTSIGYFSFVFCLLVLKFIHPLPIREVTRCLIGYLFAKRSWRNVLWVYAAEVYIMAFSTIRATNIFSFIKTSRIIEEFTITIFVVIVFNTTINVFNVFVTFTTRKVVCVDASAEFTFGSIARAGCERSLAVVRQLVMVDVLVEIEARSLGVVVVAARVVVGLLVVTLLAKLLLLAFCRRHFGGVLFPPFCSSVLEPYLEQNV
jgi:hypothetical protein